VSALWLFQDSFMDEVRYIIGPPDAKFLLGEGQEEVDKALFIMKDCPSSRRSSTTIPRVCATTSRTA